MLWYVHLDAYFHNHWNKGSRATGNGSPALKHFHPEMTYVDSTHILLAKSNFTVLDNVKRLEGQSFHVPGRGEQKHCEQHGFLGFQSWKTLKFS